MNWECYYRNLKGGGVSGIDIQNEINKLNVSQICSYKSLMHAKCVLFECDIP